MSAPAAPPFLPGDLVKYIPGHAAGDRRHPDCETGVVTSVAASGATVFVLFGGSTSAGCYPDSLVLIGRRPRP